MPPQARIGDMSQCPADVHGTLACPRQVIGPAIQGSPDVLVNFRPAVRVGDKGIHAACCGPNTWEAAMGSKTVFITGKAAHRLGDMDQHCGGVGTMVGGSMDVLTGG